MGTAVDKIETPGGADLRALLDQAETGDAAALTALKVRMRDDPELAAGLGGELANRVKNRIATKAGGKNNQIAQAALLRCAQRVRDDAAGPNPSALEALLADRVAITWMDLHRCEVLREVQDNRTWIEFYDRLAHRAHARYVAALKALAQIRRLGINVTINVAHNQAIVNGGPPS